MFGRSPRADWQNSRQDSNAEHIKPSIFIHRETFAIAVFDCAFTSVIVCPILVKLFNPSLVATLYRSMRSYIKVRVLRGPLRTAQYLIYTDGKPNTRRQALI